jgi:hypothetical protein
MKKRALLSALSLCFLAAACDSKKPTDPPQPKTAAVVPVPPATPTAPPASANQDAKPVQLAQADTTAVKDAAAPANLKGCTQGKCKVTLTVTGKTAADCKITANPDMRGVFKDNKNDFIEWTIATNGWEFDSNGIDFSGNPQFTDGQPAGAKKYKVKDANLATAPKVHNYKMNLKSTTSKETCSKDPSVVNDVQVAEP